MNNINTFLIYKTLFSKEINNLNTNKINSRNSTHKNITFSYYSYIINHFYIKYLPSSFLLKDKSCFNLYLTKQLSSDINILRNNNTPNKLIEELYNTDKTTLIIVSNVYPAKNEVNKLVVSLLNYTDKKYTKFLIVYGIDICTITSNNRGNENTNTTTKNKSNKKSWKNKYIKGITYNRKGRDSFIKDFNSGFDEIIIKYGKELLDYKFYDLFDVNTNSILNEKCVLAIIINKSNKNNTTTSNNNNKSSSFNNEFFFDKASKSFIIEDDNINRINNADKNCYSKTSSVIPIQKVLDLIKKLDVKEHIMEIKKRVML